MGDVTHLLSSTALGGGEDTVAAVKEELRSAVDYACSAPITGYVLVTITEDGLGPTGYSVEHSSGAKCKLVGSMDFVKIRLLSGLEEEGQDE